MATDRMEIYNSLGVLLFFSLLRRKKFGCGKIEKWNGKEKRENVNWRREEGKRRGRGGKECGRKWRRKKKEGYEGLVESESTKNLRKCTLLKMQKEKMMSGKPSTFFPQPPPSHDPRKKNRFWQSVRVT